MSLSLLTTGDASVLITRRLWLFMLSRCNVAAEAKLGQVDRPTLQSIAKRVVSDRYVVSGQYLGEFASISLYVCMAVVLSTFHYTLL